jgi:hypothetical protein
MVKTCLESNFNFNLAVEGTELAILLACPATGLLLSPLGLSELINFIYIFKMIRENLLPDHGHYWGGEPRGIEAVGGEQVYGCC